MRLWTQKYQAHLEKYCYKLGLSIGHNPWKYIIGILLFTALSCVGFLRFHQINNARVTFTASDSRSHVEGAVMEKFLRQNGSLHMVEVMIKSSDNGSLLRDEFRHQLWQLVSEIANDIKGHDSTNGFLSYKNMCEPYCQKNDPFYAFIKLYENNITDLELTYPALDIMGKQLFIANNIYGVTFVNGSSKVIEGFNTVILRYYMVHSEMKPMLEWESGLLRLLYESNKYPYLRGGAASDNIVSKEVKAMGTRTAPLLSISLVLLMVFLVVCSFRHRRQESKPWEALLGGAIPVLAGLTTVGLVSASGLAFQSIVVSSLFLILAIGIDDVFIMLSAWHRTDRTLDIPHRVADMVKESGCSMTVTSITNVVSFGNGVLSSTPVLQTFAIYSTVASIACFVYQLVLFPAIMTLTAPNEYKKIDDVNKSCLPDEIGFIKPLGVFHDKVWRKLARVVTHPLTAVLTIAVLICYWATAVYGISIVKVDLAVQHLAPKEAKIAQFKTEYDQAIKGMQTVATVVTQPGDLRNKTHFSKIEQLLYSFEHTSYSYGNDSTFCFLRPYLEFLNFYEADEDDSPVVFTYAAMESFLRIDPYWAPTLHINMTACKQNEPSCIEAFLFTTGFTTLSSYNEMYPLLEEWRAISDKYPELGVYSYSERSNFADQTAALTGVIWDTLLSEVICMGLSYIVLVPDTDSIIASMFALLSVNMGVFGFLSLWGVGVDPVSMAALLMSIGFSVDISAHISYHYYTVKAPTARERLEDAFLNIGWPTVQGGMSTLAAMLPIIVIPNYLLMTFLKAVALVIVFGLLHGLIVLPVFLSLIDILMKSIGRNRIVPEPVEYPSNSTSCDSLPQNLEPHRISIKSFTNYISKTGLTQVYMTIGVQFNVILPCASAYNSGLLTRLEIISTTNQLWVLLALFTSNRL
ncbi:unnamed protein product [Auanema sp. JU1783]|nr:unnamed protein product [Auanema sp. JU1783]